MPAVTIQPWIKGRDDTGGLQFALRDTPVKSSLACRFEQFGPPEYQHAPRGRNHRPCLADDFGRRPVQSR
jgi:hypothetical protein